MAYLYVNDWNLLLINFAKVTICLKMSKIFHGKCQLERLEAHLIDIEHLPTSFAYLPLPPLYPN